jgi:hypothetical protein
MLGLVKGRFATGERALHMPEIHDNSSNIEPEAEEVAAGGSNDEPGVHSKSISIPECP